MMEPRRMDVPMELICTLAVVSRHQGGTIEDFSRGLIKVRSRHKKSTPSEEPIIIVRTSSNNTLRAGYNLIGNIEGFFIEFLNQGRATVSLKEPSCNIIITKADPDELTAFIIYLKKFLPKDSQVHVSIAALEPPSSQIYLDCQERYKLKMENIIGMDTNLDHFTDLEIRNSTLELAGYQLPIAGAIRKMKNLTTLRLKRINLRSTTFLEIESRRLKQLHILHCDIPLCLCKTKVSLCKCKTPLPIASLFKKGLCYKDSLIDLHLEKNQWPHAPSAIFEFRNLLKLSLSKNRITKLPDKFTNLPKLQELSLSSNQIRHVPTSIFTLQHLLKLSLSGNLITKLPNMFAKLSKLQVLLLSRNGIERVPPSIFALQNLYELDLSDNLISVLPDKFTNLSKLQVLLISMNQVRYLPPSMLSLHLKKVNIDHNVFNFGIVPSFGSELIVHSLKELSYRTILKHKLIVKEGMLPKTFLKDLSKYRQCACGCKFVDEGQHLSFYCNLYDISNITGYNGDPHLSVPVRGKMCTSLKSCFLDRFTKSN